MTAPASVVKDSFWRATLLRARGANVESGIEDAFLSAIEKASPCDGISKQRMPFVRAVGREAAILLPRADRATFCTLLARSLESAFERLPYARQRPKRPHF